MKKRIRLTENRTDIRGFWLYAERKAGEIYDIVRPLGRNCAECYDHNHGVNFIQLGGFEWLD